MRDEPDFLDRVIDSACWVEKLSKRPDGLTVHPVDVAMSFRRSISEVATGSIEFMAPWGCITITLDPAVERGSINWTFKERA